MADEVNTDVTVRELDELCTLIAKQRVLIAEAEAQVTPLNIGLAVMEQKAAAYLEALGREKFQAEAGTIFLQETWRFKLPQTDEDKAKFFGHLREKGLYDRYATVNATSFNAYCKAEWEVAQAEGRGMEFALPGVQEPTYFKKASFRKATS